MKTKNYSKLRFSFLTAVLSVFFIASFATAQTVIVPDFKVSDAPFGTGTGMSAVQSLPNGGFVVVWTDLRASPAKIYASIYNQSGALIRDDYRIDDCATASWCNYTGSGGTAVDSNGNFFVTYVTTTDGGTTFYGRIRKFLPNGDPAGPSVEVRESGTLPDHVVQVSRGENNKIVVAYRAGGNRFYRIFDNNLIPLTSSIQANQTPASGGVGLASEYNGNFVVVWPQLDGFPLDGMMRARLYDPAGNPRTNEFPVEPFMTGGSDPRAVYNKDGHFIVVWWGPFGEVYGRVFDSNGNPITDLLQFGRYWESNASAYRPTVDTDGAGNFVVAYTFWSDVTPMTNYATTISSYGAILRSFYPATQWPSVGWGEQDIAYIGGGKFVVSYPNYFFDSAAEIYATIIQDDTFAGMTPIAGPGTLVLMASGLGFLMKRRVGKRKV